VAYNIPSKYLPIWNTLKATSTATVVTHPCLHRRIKKAVIRRKDEDLAYKFALGEQHKRAKLSTRIEGNAIIFTLHYLPYFNSIGAY
jgi:hypothetical protein